MDPGEEALLQFFANHALRTERPTKGERRAGKTPDYRVFEGAEFRFFCELKGVVEDDWLAERIAQAPPGAVVAAQRDDPAFNRLTDDIHRAVNQLDAVNPNRAWPNVLAFVNYEEVCDVADLLAVLTGNFYSDDGSRHPIYRQFSQGRIREEKKRIDLYLWLNDQSEGQFVFTEVDPGHHAKLCSCFKVSGAQLAKR